MLRKLACLSSISTIYIITAGSIGALLFSTHLLGIAAQAEQEPQYPHRQPTSQVVQTTSGKPTRITIPSVGIDLPVDAGRYDKASKTWSLSPDHAQFATMSALANNQKGATFIYGHGTDAVFGKIGSDHPPIGTIAYIYTDNNHVFTYKLYAIQDKAPTDTQILKQLQSGPPRLVIQTCTGVFSEWRTMFLFSFEKVS